MAARIVIKVDNVWKVYEMGNVKVPALRGLNLQVKEKEFLAIMGPSGSGKSTAMHIIGCLDIPTKGEVYLDGKNIAKMTESELATIRGRKIGFVFQHFNLIPTLTALENVMLPMIFQNVPDEKKKSRAIALLKRVGLTERMGHHPSELSGGEQQRVAIARALANDPEIILGDEPTGNLDSKNGEMVMQLLSDLHKKEQKTIIIITHETEVADYAERKLILRDGKLIKDDHYK
ncbi:MAG: ABC transporter ATP-binding protein [DPANN group archaeon]|nr:ABC transporter ATP-binding protein [DPANN group archaeon]